MRLTALYVHPIKSCAGIALARARVTRRGLEHDRRWMVTDERGRFLSQRVLPAMQRVRLRIDGESLVATLEGLPPLSLPHLFDDGAAVECEVWEQRCAGVRHEAGSAWFTRALARPAQLVCMPDRSERPVADGFGAPGDLVSFADGFPLLVVNQASLDALDAAATVRSDVRRFRPNLVIGGAAPWAEDDWRALTVGALALRTPKPCARCAIPGIDPDSLEITPEPLRTLAALRKRGNQVYFGVNAIADGVGELAVGDLVALRPPHG